MNTAHAHPPVSLYVKVIVVLAVVTAVEIFMILPSTKQIYDAAMPWFHPLVVPLLIVLSLLKFFGVVLYFMHLRQDPGVPRLVFFAPLGLAFLMVMVLMALFGTLLLTA
jgi:hypothetical protein